MHVDIVAYLNKRIGRELSHRILSHVLHNTCICAVKKIIHPNYLNTHYRDVVKQSCCECYTLTHFFQNIFYLENLKKIRIEDEIVKPKHLQNYMAPLNIINLTLINCGIKDDSLKMISGLLNLEKIDLSHNFLEVWDENTLKKCDKLNHINLAENYLIEIKLSHTGLKFLNVRSNDIRKCNLDMCKHLQHVNLSYNTSLEYGDVRLPSELKELNLGNCGTIKSMEFYDMFGNTVYDRLTSIKIDMIGFDEEALVGDPLSLPLTPTGLLRMMPNLKQVKMCVDGSVFKRENHFRLKNDQSMKLFKNVVSLRIIFYVPNVKKTRLLYK